MALGNNMKIDRLIPLKKVKAKVEAKVEAETKVKTEVETEIEVVEVVEVVTSAAIIDEPQPHPEPQHQNIETDSIKIIFKPSRRKTQKRILIDIEGSLTINNIELLYTNINGVFENYDFVEVTMKNVSEFDLTLIQLFHAIRVLYWPLKKHISINAELVRDDRQLLNACGFTEFQTQKTS